MGLLTPEQARKDPSRHVITQYLGMSPEVRVSPYIVTDQSLQKGDIYLLCSDGFFRRTAIGELGEVLAPEEIQTEEQIRRRLREIADCDRRRGERDNISAVYIKVR